MVLHNFLEPGTVAPVRRADIVFYIADRVAGGWRSREMAHAGLAAADCPAHRLDEGTVRVSVYHMADRIRRDDWSLGARSCVDLCGVMYEQGAELDDVIRDAIIDAAVTFYQPTSSALNFYWMGDPNPTAHSLYPGVTPAYAFTCASFVHYCYEAGSAGQIVDYAAIPLLTQQQRDLLQQWFDRQGIGRHVQQGFFRRLYPSYLMAAFQQDSYPFHPASWDQWQDHGIYVPAPAPAPSTQAPQQGAAPSP